jgi:hypothetical protein
VYYFKNIIMNNLIIKRSQLVTAVIETAVPAAQQKFYFQDIPNLSRNNIVVYGLEAFSRTQLSVTPNGNAVITAAATAGVTVTLRDTNKVEYLYQEPYYTLIRANNFGLVTMLKPRVINLTDCYITVANPAGIAQNEAAAIVLYYDFINQ